MWSSLVCALLKATLKYLINDLEKFDFLFEALCERDLRIYAESFGAKLYLYQDYANKEIDAVIELNDGKWCAIEIKLGANQIDQAAKNLLSLKNKIKVSGGIAPTSLCIICEMFNATYERPDGVFVVLITTPKN